MVLFGPGGLRAPPVVADGSEAGHCFCHTQARPRPMAMLGEHYYQYVHFFPHPPPLFPELGSRKILRVGFPKDLFHRIMKTNETSNSDIIKMSATQTFETLLNQVKSSNLNYHLQQSPFSAFISLKKSFVKDRAAPYPQPHFCRLTRSKPEIGNLCTYREKSSAWKSDRCCER